MPPGFDFRLASKAVVPLLVISKAVSSTASHDHTMRGFLSELEIVYVRRSSAGTPEFDRQRMRIS